MVITFYTKSVYGNPLLYAADDIQRAWLTSLTGSKTLSKHHVEALEALGHTFERVFEN